MARIWREYIAPDGRKYYYNVNTKQSTWHKPASYDDEVDENRDVKRLKKIEPKPHVALELSHGWHLIVCDTGRRFFYDAGTKTSVWDLPDEESRSLLDSLDKNKLVALIGLARGYSFGGLHIYDELVSDLAKLKQEKETEDSNEVEQKGENEENRHDDNDSGDDNQNESNEAETNDHGLVAGYSSSLSEDEEDEEKKPPSISIMETVEEPVNTSEDKKVLWGLFSRYDLNPYSAWPFEMKKIRDDPDFHKVMDDFIREDAFEEWCARSLSGNRNVPVDEEQLEEEEEEDLEPTKYHYLAHIVSKSTINPTTIFMDIRNENKTLFKKYNIRDFIPSKKDQESFVSKLLFYYKRMNIEERRQVFIQLLQQHAKTITSALSKDLHSIQNCLDLVVDNNDPYAVETKLFKMEKAMELRGELSNLTEEPKYYVLGIRDKMLELNNYLNTLL